MKSKFLFALALMAAVVGGCSKNDDDEVIIANTPRGEVPDELVGKWLNGTFAMSNYWTSDGRLYAGTPYSRSSAFNFSKNGDAQFFQVVHKYDGGCNTDGYTYSKGTVKFNETDQSFTYYPQLGKYRGYYSCDNSKNFDRSMEKSELVPIVLYWKKQTDSNNQQWMVVRFAAQDPDSQASYFKPANW